MSFLQLKKVTVVAGWTTRKWIAPRKKSKKTPLARRNNFFERLKTPCPGFFRPNANHLLLVV
jgi:hypothetical protein